MLFRSHSFLRQVDNWNPLSYNAERLKSRSNRRGERRSWGTPIKAPGRRRKSRPGAPAANQRSVCGGERRGKGVERSPRRRRGRSGTDFAPTTTRRGEYRSIRRMPLRALGGRVTRLTNMRATAKQKGRDRPEETSDCAFVLLIFQIRRNEFPCVELLAL